MAANAEPKVTFTLTVREAEALLIGLRPLAEAIVYGCGQDAEPLRKLLVLPGGRDDA